MKVKKLISKTWLYVLLFVVMVLTISMKKDYHMDEIYSYGLANNVGQTSIHPNYAPYTYENPADVYLDYMVVEEGEPFIIANCWYNQERESSPPLYYFAVYLVSFLVKERFSRWTAASINLIFMPLTFWAFRKILQMYGVKEKEQIIYSLFFIFSPAILNVVSFFRMYTMAMFAATWITYLILKYRKKENIVFYISMVIASILAALTQYYLIFYLFFISLIYGISLLCNKEWIKAVKYIVTMAIAGLGAYVIFPAMIDQLFSADRGAEGLDNLKQGIDIHWAHLKEYLSILNDQVFGNLLWILLILLVAGVCYGLMKKKSILSDKDKLWDISMRTLPALLYVVVVSKVAPYQTDRYIVAVYAVVMAAFILAARKVCNLIISEKQNIKTVGLCALCAIVLFSAWKDFNWKYLYLNSEEFLEQMDEYADTDCLCVLDVGWKISGNFNEMIKFDTVTFFQNEISALAEMEELKSKDEYILYVVSLNPEEVIEQIHEICPQIKQSEYIGKSDSSEIYYLSGNISK